MDNKIQDYYGVIYMIINNINGKRYIGFTTKDIKIRLSEHVSLAKTSPRDRIQLLHKAIRKYGKENFSIIRLDVASDLMELRQKEQQYIELYETFAPLNKNGYNQTRGGDGVVGIVHDDKTIQLMKEKASMRFADLNEREQQRQRQYIWHNDPVNKSIHSKKIKDAHTKNPEIGKIHSKKMRKWAAIPENRKSMSERAKKQFATPESRIEFGNRQRKRMADPDVRLKISIKSKEVYANNPQLSINMSEMKKKLHAEKPELAVKHREFMKNRYIENPELGKQQSQDEKKRAARRRHVWNEIMELHIKYNSISKTVDPKPVRKRGAMKIDELLEIKRGLEEKIIALLA